MQGYRVWAEIDLAAFRHNISVVRRALGPRPRILAVVKANAYGHGAVPLARAAIDAGCSMLGVGDSTEALQLRESGITGPILILGAIVEEEISQVVRHDVSVTVHSPDLLPLLDEEAARRDRTLRVHLKIDTGLSRLGAPPGRAVEISRAILGSSHLRFEGLSTHLADAGNPETTRGQLALFRSVIGDLEGQDIHPPVLHAANSAGLFTCPASHFDMVRPGVALYGLDPGPLARLNLPLRPVLSLKTRIAFLKNAAPGSAVGYGGTYHTPGPTRLATCPVGYNDGYPYALSNRGEAVVRGRRVPLAGRVSMDYVIFDVGGVPDVALGDEVTLIGGGVRAEELARRCETLSLEITCRLGNRVRRVPVNVEAFRSVA